jgi:hypothetical protein
LERVGENFQNEILINEPRKTASHSELTLHENAEKIYLKK